eukprot:1274888-Prymnesium_polylepis.1
MTGSVDLQVGDCAELRHTSTCQLVDVRRTARSYLRWPPCGTWSELAGSTSVQPGLRSDEHGPQSPSRPGSTSWPALAENCTLHNARAVGGAIISAHALWPCASPNIAARASGKEEGQGRTPKKTEEECQWLTFMEWVTSSGGRVDAVRLANCGGGLRGIKATRDLAK